MTTPCSFRSILKNLKDQAKKIAAAIERAIDRFKTCTCAFVSSHALLLKSKSNAIFGVPFATLRLD
jgi:hypothetical protein